MAKWPQVGQKEGFRCVEILFLQLRASEQLPFIPACCANVIIFHRAAGGEESGGSTAGQG